MAKKEKEHGAAMAQSKFRPQPDGNSGKHFSQTCKQTCAA